MSSTFIKPVFPILELCMLFPQFTNFSYFKLFWWFESFRGFAIEQDSVLQNLWLLQQDCDLTCEIRKFWSEFGYIKRQNQSIYHLLLHGLTPRTPPENPGGMVQFLYFFFLRRGGELFSFRNDFGGPGGIHTGLVRILVSGIQL